MYSCSYGMRNLVLLICFKSSIVSCIRLYSCVIFRICDVLLTVYHYVVFVNFTFVEMGSIIVILLTGVTLVWL
jgi:hypothetical protein